MTSESLSVVFTPFFRLTNNIIFATLYIIIYNYGIKYFLCFSVDKWRKHRRIITPVFNANLLEQFFPVFNEKNKILIRNLKKELGKTQPFNLWDYIAPTALDIICRKYSCDVFVVCKNALYMELIFCFYRNRYGLRSRHSIK